MEFSSSRKSSPGGLALILSVLLHVFLGLIFSHLSVSCSVNKSALSSVAKEPLETQDDLRFQSFPVYYEDKIIALSGAEASEIPPELEEIVVESKKVGKSPVEPVIVEKKNLPGQPGQVNKDFSNEEAQFVKSTNTSGMGSPPKTGTTFFGVETSAQKIVYVLDGSSSMSRRGAFPLARQQLISSVQALPEDAQFQVLVYNSLVRFLLLNQQEWISASPTNKQRTIQALKDLFPEGSTIHDKALPLALSLEPQVIFFLTDGGNLDRDYLRTITNLNRHGAAIHVLELHSSTVEGNSQILAQFAENNQGQYRSLTLSRSYP